MNDFSVEVMLLGIQAGLDGKFETLFTRALPEIFSVHGQTFADSRCKHLLWSDFVFFKVAGEYSGSAAFLEMLD